MLQVRSRCPRCNATASRRGDLGKHAQRVHGLRRGTREFDNFRKDARRLNGRGSSRSVSKRIIRQALAGLPRNATPAVIAQRVLQAVNVSATATTTECDTNAEDDDDDGGVDQRRAARPVPQGRSVVSGPRARTTQGEGAFDVQYTGRDPQTQRITKATLSHVGLATQYSDFMDAATSYERVMTNRGELEPSTIRAQAGMVNRFTDYALTHMPHLATELEALCSTAAIFKFGEHLEAFLQPNSVMNHAHAIMSYLKLLLLDTNLQRAIGFTHGWTQKVVNARVCWSTLRSQVAKKARRKQKEAMQEPKGFWDMNAPFDLILEFADITYNALSGHIRDGTGGPNGVGIPYEERVRLRALAATYLLMNGVRLCVATGMTRAELLAAESHLSSRVVRVAASKTRKTRGRAPVVLKDHQYRTLLALSADNADGDPVLGPLPKGRASEVLFAPVKNYIRGQTGRDVTVTFNLARQAVESFAHLVKSMRAKDADAQFSARDAICNYLQHSPAVRDTFYVTRSASLLVFEQSLYEQVVATIAALALIRRGKIQLEDDLGQGKLRSPKPGATNIPQSRSLTRCPFLYMSPFSFQDSQTERFCIRT